MTVRAILDLKGRDVVTVTSDHTLAQAAEHLTSHKIGALVVLAEGRVSGILSERDIVKAVSRAGAGALASRVGESMTSAVTTCQPYDTIGEVMNRMTAGRFRHMPVVDDGKLAGIISIGDVVKHRLAEIERESSALKEYIRTA